MSRAQEPHKAFLPFRSPFRTILPKSLYLSPKLLALLNDFEETLAERLKKLKPADKDDVLCCSWMICAMETLCAIHTDIKTLITSLELPVGDWDDKWIDVYLVNSVKLLDVCTAFSSEISRLQQGCLYLQCVLHNLNSGSSNQFVWACSSLDGWSKHIASKNLRLDNCFKIIDSLAQMLDIPKVKNSSKGMVLMQAMYGVKAVTLFVCSVFSAAFSGTATNLKELQVPGTCLWASTFAEIQTFVNSEIRNIYSGGRVAALVELEAVCTGAKDLYPFLKDEIDPVNTELLKNSTLSLEKSTEKFSIGFDMLAKELDRFFQIVLSGRDALIYNLRIGGSITDQIQTGNNVKDQMVG